MPGLEQVGAARATRRAARPLGLLAATALAACASGGQGTAGPGAAATPVDVAMGRLSQNMSRAEVEALLGLPDGMQQAPGEVGYQYLARPVPRRGTDLTDFYAVFRDDRLVGWGVGGVQTVAGPQAPALVIAALGERPPPPAVPAPEAPPAPGGTVVAEVGPAAAPASPESRAEPRAERATAPQARWHEAVTAALSAELRSSQPDPPAAASTDEVRPLLVGGLTAPAPPARASGEAGPLREKLADVRRRIAPHRLAAAEPPPGPGPEAGILGSARLFIHHRAGDPAAAARAQGLAQRLEQRGAGKVTVRPVRLAIDGLSVRYFHGVDRPGAAAVLGDAAGFAGDGRATAAALPADFTSFQPAPRPGIIEIWLPSVGA